MAQDLPRVGSEKSQILDSELGVYLWKQMLADSGNQHIQKRTPLTFIDRLEHDSHYHGLRHDVLSASKVGGEAVPGLRGGDGAERGVKGHQSTVASAIIVEKCI